MNETCRKQNKARIINIKYRGELERLLRELAILPEDPNLILSSHRVTQKYI